MKVGTTPKMTVRAIGLIALIIIGFVGLRQMNAPIVEERVYLAPWEDGTARPRNNPKGFPTDTAQGTESWNDLSQIAAAEPTAGTESINDFVDQPNETDVTQFAIETELELDFTTDISASSENTDQSAEDVMYAYLEAWRSSDFKAIDSLRTEQYRRSVQADSGDGGSTNISDKAPEVIIQARLLGEAVRKLRKQTLLVSSEYAGDEFHFQLRIPDSELQRISDQVGTMLTCMSYQQVKMQKENDMWRVYVVLFDPDH